MAVQIVMGAQWGDEGKGKIIDYLSVDADFVVRFHGGNNAGHTVVNEFGKFPLHLIPSGIFSKKAKACITNGVVLDLEVLTAEIEMLEEAGIKLTNRLFISPRCHLIMPYHKTLDRLYEEAKGKDKTGTTGRGIGPVYADKVSYNGIRVFDLLDDKQFSRKLSVQLAIKNKIIQALSPQTTLFPYKKHSSAKNRVMQTFAQVQLSQNEIEQKFFILRKKILPFIQEPYPVLTSALEKTKTILYEGAHGVFLDNDWGTYPFVTASTVLTGGVNATSGIQAKQVSDVIGVVKAYTTRVGTGPFPTELEDGNGEKLRIEGNEFGTTTGRARRCGWFDAELIRFAAQINGFTQIALTKIDVLDTFRELKIATGYQLKGKEVNYFDGDAEFLSKVKPIYKTLPGWNTSTKGISRYQDLPENAKVYIKEIEKQTGVRIGFVSTGPARNEIIVR